LRTSITLIAVGLITGLIVGYNLNTSPSREPEIRKAKPVEKSSEYVEGVSEVRRAKPVERSSGFVESVSEVRRAKPVDQGEIARSANEVAYANVITGVDADDNDELATEESDQDEESDPYYVPPINLSPASVSTPVYPDTGYVPVTRAYAESRYEPSDIPKNYTVLHPDGTASFIYGHGNNATVLNPDGSASFIYGH
jgi:hypothetical protein